MIRHQNHVPTIGPSPPFVLPFLGGAAPPSFPWIFLKGLQRFGAGGLAIIHELKSAIYNLPVFPKPMNRAEMLDLARRLVKEAGRTR